MLPENEAPQKIPTDRVVREQLMIEASSPGPALGQSFPNSNELINSKVTLNPGSL